MTRYLTVIPAYSRDYKNQKEVQAAWDAGQDFYIQDFKLNGYISKSEATDYIVNVRYSNGQKVYTVKG